MGIYELNAHLWFPHPQCAEEGLLAVGGDLSPQRLVLAYSRGIFPWYSEGEPILWWSPDPRMIITTESLHVSRRFARSLKQGKFELRIDTAFRQVMQSCARVPRPGQHGTWILPEMVVAYCRLHEAGLAHSVEIWIEGTLKGGLYGLSLGGAFFGESMFSLVPDASKAAMVHLVEQCRLRGIHLIDCQVANPHLTRMGGVEIPRVQFLERLKEALQQPTQPGPWQVLKSDFIEAVE